MTAGGCCFVAALLGNLKGKKVKMIVIARVPKQPREIRVCQPHLSLYNTQTARLLRRCASRNDEAIFNLIRKIEPVFIYWFDQSYLLFTTASFYSLFLVNSLLYSIKIVIVNQNSAIIFRGETFGVYFILMFSYPPRQIRRYPGIQRCFIRCRHNVNCASFSHSSAIYRFPSLRGSICECRHVRSNLA